MRPDRQVCSWLPAAVILVALLTPARTLAHRLDVSVHTADGKVVVEARYHDDMPVRGADVTVTDTADNVLAEGTTDAEGRFLFGLAAIPAQISVVVKTGDGHRGEATIEQKDLEGAAGGGKEHDHAGLDSSASDLSVATDSSAEHDDLHEIEATLVRVESELHEIAHELEHLSQRHAGTYFERVLAGVGFILGLAGVAAYCLARRPTHS